MATAYGTAARQQHEPGIVRAGGNLAGLVRDLRGVGQQRGDHAVEFLREEDVEHLPALRFGEEAIFAQQAEELDQAARR